MKRKSELTKEELEMYIRAIMEKNYLFKRFIGGDVAATRRVFYWRIYVDGRLYNMGIDEQSKI